jgi:hypothetical protein
MAEIIKIEHDTSKAQQAFADLAKAAREAGIGVDKVIDAQDELGDSAKRAGDKLKGPVDGLDKLGDESKPAKDGIDAVTKALDKLQRRQDVTADQARLMREMGLSAGAAGRAARELANVRAKGGLSTDLQALEGLLVEVEREAEEARIETKRLLSEDGGNEASAAAEALARALGKVERQSGAMVEQARLMRQFGLEAQGAARVARQVLELRSSGATEREIREITEEMVKLEREADEARESIRMLTSERRGRGLRDDIRDISGELHNMRGAASAGLGSMSEGLATMAKRALAAAVAVVGIREAIEHLGRKPVEIFTGTETALIGVGKTSGLAADELDDLLATVEELSVSADGLPRMATGLLSIAESAGQVGVGGVENLERYIDTFGRLEVATDLHGEEAVKILTRLLNVQGEGPEVVDRFASVLVKLGNTSAASEREIAVVANELGRATAQFRIGTTDIPGRRRGGGLRRDGGDERGRLHATMGDRPHRGHGGILARSWHGGRQRRDEA